MGSIPAKRHQQIRNGTTSCSEIRHQQTWQSLKIVLQTCYPTFAGNPWRPAGKKLACVCSSRSKFKHELVAINTSDRLIESQNSHNARLGNNYIVPQPKCDYRKDILESVFPRTIRDWNRLPPDITSAVSLGAFKSQTRTLYIFLTFKMSSFYFFLCYQLVDGGRHAVEVEILTSTKAIDLSSSKWPKTSEYKLTRVQIELWQRLLLPARGGHCIGYWGRCMILALIFAKSTAC